MGNFGDGHYFTFSNVADKWYCFNDESVQEIDQTSVSNKYAYILFYKKCN
jgi:ubiquitin C-terminal hydrolase